MEHKSFCAPIFQEERAMRALYALLSSLLLLTSCKTPDKSLKVLATPVPHAVMLEEIARPQLAAQGIELEIIVVEDYYIGNRALDEGEADANFFQHELFLKQQEQQFGYKLTILTPVHIEPMGLYSSKFKDLSQVRTVAIPIDPSNRARALALLEEAHVHPEKILEVDGVLLAHSYEEVDLAAIPTNYALQIGLVPSKDALFQEGSNSPYANVIVIREGDEQRADLAALKSAMTSPEMRQFIETYYGGAITPAF